MLTAKVSQVVNYVIESLTFDQLHRVERILVVMTDLENGHNIGVVQACCRTSLTLETAATPFRPWRYDAATISKPHAGPSDSCSAS